MSQESASPIGVGVLTVLTVLLILTLAVFSALTYASARADLALSHINADTVAAYYAADTQAARLLEEFREGLDDTFEETLSMTGAQSLHIHFVRDADGNVRILAWNTVPAQEEEELEGFHLPVFDGTLPSG